MKTKLVKVPLRVEGDRFRLILQIAEDTGSTVDTVASILFALAIRMCQTTGAQSAAPEQDEITKFVRDREARRMPGNSRLRRAKEQALFTKAVKRSLKGGDKT
jgi:hypothetical protein